MKHLIQLLTIILAAAYTFTACSSSDDDPAPAMQVVSSNLIFSSKAANGTIEVKNAPALAATTNKDWCRAAVSGNTVTVTVDKNDSFESRNAVVSLTSGSQKTDVSLTQMGAIWSIRGTDEYITGDEDTLIVIPATLDFEYTVDMPDWIEGEAVNDGYQVHLLDNNTGAGREGIVTFTSRVGKKAIKFRQFGTKSVLGTYTARFTGQNGVMVTRDIELVNTDLKDEIIIRGLSQTYDIPAYMEAGALKIAGSSLVHNGGNKNYVFAVLHCTNNTNFEQQGYSYEGALALTSENNMLIPSFTFTKQNITFEDWLGEEQTVIVDGFSLISYTQPTVSYYFQDKVLDLFTNITLAKAGIAK